MSSTTQNLTTIGETLQKSANAQTIYGEPIKLENKVVVPVSKVFYGFGAGGLAADTQGSASTDSKDQRGAGTGGGGGMKAYPVGALEITVDKTRFIPVSNSGSGLLWLLAGAALGVLSMKRGTAKLT